AQLSDEEHFCCSCAVVPSEMMLNAAKTVVPRLTSVLLNVE
ncbi:hypothetical protein AVEN_248180-1, partial [Araneus ventricosus]